MPLSIVRDDISHVKADAIVNAANEMLQRGGGVCGAIFAAAGAHKLQKACDRIGHCDTGSAVATPAYALHARYVIHAVGPIWHGGTQGERDLLASCYRSSFELAASLRCRSIAFPLISTGIFGYPKREALDVAQDEIRRFLNQHEMDVILVLYDKAAMQLADDLRMRVERYIDDVYVGENTYISQRQRWEREAFGFPTIGDTASWTADVDFGISDFESLQKLEGTEAPAAAAGEPSFDESMDTAKDGRTKRSLCPSCGALLDPGAVFCKRCGASVRHYAKPTVGGKWPRESPSVPAAPSAPSAPKPCASSAPMTAPSLLPTMGAPAPSAPREARNRRQMRLPHPLRNLLDHLDSGFSDTLMAMIDERGLKDSEVYKRANLSRQHFSKIRSNPHYQPKKNTVLALAVALELSPEEASMLLERAGFAFSHADQRDVIVEFFIKEGIYDVFEINDALFAFDQPLLG